MFIFMVHLSRIFPKKQNKKYDWRSIQLWTSELQARMPLTIGGELSSYLYESTEFIALFSTFSKEVSLISGSRTLLSEWVRLVVRVKPLICLSFEDFSVSKSLAKSALQSPPKAIKLFINNSYCIYCLLVLSILLY